MNEDAFAERDAYGLTLDDWESFLGFGPEDCTGPALLWWALADSTSDGVYTVNPNPFPDLLRSVASDARALAMLAASSRQDDVLALAPALHNLHRRIAAAAEIAQRAEDLKEDDQRNARQDPPDRPAPPSSQARSRR